MVAGEKDGAVPQPLRLEEPGEWQVVQRNAEQIGLIVIEGTCLAERVDCVQARLVLMANASGRETGWQRLAGTLPGRFSGTVRVLAGGWYELQVQALREGKIVAETRIPHIGVGEIFVIAGQSNAANYGDPVLKAAEDRAVAYGNGKWRPAADPMPGAGGQGGSCWCVFADLLVRSLDMPVAIASVAVGGSAMASWLPEGENCSLLRNVLQAMKPGGVRAVLWHQGETDNGNNTTAEQYYTGMRRIIEGSSRDAGYPVQWFVARASFIPLKHTKHNLPPVLSIPVRSAQERLWKDGIALQGPDTDDLVGLQFRCSDEIHMSRCGLVTHGERWFAMVWSQIFARQPLPRVQSFISGVVPEVKATGKER